MGIFKPSSLRMSIEGASSTWRALAIGLPVAFGGVLFGYDTGIISGIMAMDSFKKQFSTEYMDTNGQPDISPAQSSTVVSILSAGTFCGALGSPFLSDTIGRRWGLFVSCWVFIGGVILQTAAAALPMMLAGRFFAGAGVGLLSVIIPLYQCETAPKWIRGAIVGAYQWAITIGLLLAAVVNNATHEHYDSSAYRIPIAVQFLWAILLAVCMLFLPETPRYLIKRGKHDSAAASLSKLRGLPVEDESIRQELSEIKDNYTSELAIAVNGSYLDCFRGRMLKRTFTGIALQSLSQMSGVNFIFYYGTNYFLNSGISNAFLITMITSTVNVACTIPGILSIDRFGRRPLLLVGAVGQGLSQLAVALLGTLTTQQDANGKIIVLNYAAQKALVAFVCIYIFFFASTWGPTTWVVPGEIYPLQVRARAISMATACLWLINWAIAYSTPYLVNYGPGYANLQSKIFFVWFGSTIIMVTFVYFFIYETKGLTLEEVDQMYEETKSARHSAKWRPSHVVASHGEHAKDAKDGLGVTEAEIAS